MLLLPIYFIIAECKSYVHPVLLKQFSCISELNMCTYQIKIFLGWHSWSKGFLSATPVCVCCLYLGDTFTDISKPKHGAAGAKLHRCLQVHYHCCHEKQNSDCLFMTSLPSLLHLCQVSTHKGWV